VYNLNNNTGFVNVGTSHDTSEFAVESISRWWEAVGKHTFPGSKRIYINCDCGGSNDYRKRIREEMSVVIARASRPLSRADCPQ
jgi:hypothetical protein